MPGRARRTSSGSPPRRSLPSRTSRAPRASMRDGSDVDEIIQAMTMSPGSLRRSPMKPVPKRKAPMKSDSSESDSSPPKSRRKVVSRQTRRRSSSASTASTSEDEETTPAKQLRGRPRKAVPPPPESDEDDDVEEEGEAEAEDEQEDEDGEEMEQEGEDEQQDEEEALDGEDEEEDEEGEEQKESEEDEEESEDDHPPVRARRRLFLPPDKVPGRRRRKEDLMKQRKAVTMDDGDNEESDSAVSSDEDGRYDIPTVDEAKSLVKSVYLPILKQNAKEMNTLFSTTFRSAVMNMQRKRYKVPHGKIAPPLKLQRKQLKFDREINMIEDSDGEQGNPVPVTFIDTRAIRPRMKHWVHIEHNIKTEDNLRLSHIPYVDDDHDSVAFCRELTKAFPEGIHGTRRGWGKHISDYLLYLLMKQTIPQWEKTGNEKRYLMRAIYKLFPNKLSARQLVFTFPSLEQRFVYKTNAQKALEEAKKDDMCHSISTMLCVKCHQYDCLLHGVSSAEFRMHRKPRGRKRRATQRPCGDECYLLLPEVQEEASASNAENSPEKKPPPKPRKRREVPPYSSTAQTLFQKMIHNNRHPYCQIASMMEVIAKNEKRSCQEIYYMAQVVPPPERERSPDDILKRKISIKEQQTMFRMAAWSNGQGKMDNSEPPQPCRHKGPCSNDLKDCYCGQHSTMCSKYCCCGPDCKMRFPGCRCQPGQCRTKQCQCFYAKWECDPDVCKSCNCGPNVDVKYMFERAAEETVIAIAANGEATAVDTVDEEMDEVERRKKAEEQKRKEEETKRTRDPVPVCSNINIQRGNYKTLKVGISNVAGWGCFVGEVVEKGEFIAEYTGEVISKWEAERRGRVYDEYKSSYIFALNSELSVDATRFGNHIRFANHSDKHPNCYSQIIIVNGEHRIGIFAKRRLEAGEELLFDYQYDKKWKEQYVPVEITKVGKVKKPRRRGSPGMRFRSPKKKTKTE